MTYTEYLKQKIINLYLQKQKVGKHFVEIKDFDSLISHINEDNRFIKQNIHSISEVLQDIIKPLKTDFKLKNKIGSTFLIDLEQAREDVELFLQQTPLKQVQITTEQKKELIEKYTEVANKYGLKEFYYSLDPLLNPEENFNKALLLLDKTKEDLNKLQQSLNIKEHYKIGNGILSIQINSQQQTNDNGDYDFLSNTIRLKDENSTFPLIHEYIHFIDKTTATLLLTGKTTQQLYEINEEKNIDINFLDCHSKEYEEYKKNRKYSDTELKELFDMSIFTQIDHKKEGSLWAKFKQAMLVIVFNKEINQSKHIQETFNQNYSQEDNIKEFKQIIFDWIEDKTYPNKELLKKDINNIFENKKVNTENYSKEEFEVLEKTRLFKEAQEENNYFMKCSKIFDSINSERENKSTTMPGSNIEFINNQINKYYQTQKEMLARTIEQALKEGKHDQLSDRLTTPQLSQEEKQMFFEIIKSWQNISSELLVQQKKQNTSNMVQKVLGKFREFKTNQIEKEFKLR